RPFFFHTAKLGTQFEVLLGHVTLFGSGLSALLTLMVISTGLVVLFVLGPLTIDRLYGNRGRFDARSSPVPFRFRWLVYFGALGAGFMLIEVSILQRFVLLLGHP